MEMPKKSAATAKHKAVAAATNRTDAKSSRSKQDKGQKKSADDRYKEMLNTTMDIHQEDIATDVGDSRGKSRVVDQYTQTRMKEPSKEEKTLQTVGDSTKEVTIEVPSAKKVTKKKTVVIQSNISQAPEPKSVESNVVHRLIPSGKGNVVVSDERKKSQQDTTPFCVKHVTSGGNVDQSVIRPKLCESCTVSMLSYIAVLRDVLDGLSNEIANQQAQSLHCPECIKDRIMQRNIESKKAQRPHDLPLNIKSDKIDASSARNMQDSYSSNCDRNAEKQKNCHQLEKHNQQSYGGSAATSAVKEPEEIQKNDSYSAGSSESPGCDDKIHQTAQSGGPNQTKEGQEHRFEDAWNREHQNVMQTNEAAEGETHLFHPNESRLIDHSRTPDYLSDQSHAHPNNFGVGVTSHPAGTDQPHIGQHRDAGNQQYGYVPRNEVIHSPASPFFQDPMSTDGILTTLSNEERGVYGSTRGRAGWETLTDSQDHRDTFLGPSSAPEAYVTMATTNAEAISCLVLGSSLLLCRTTRTLCALITDGVSPSLRAPLASVFQVVQSVRSLDTVGTTKVSLLDQPDLGIFFRKLHAWRLVQFTKCIFLNPDTLVVQNSDELFCHDELSAVPDIGWPDCFNSGVFVFQPSIDTFCKMVDFAEAEGSYDGGDQGLLNAFFKSWSKDIHKKLSFIYNLMANVSYTYTPAFKQFGRNVKIVQFHGPFKPWHVKFYTDTSQIAPSTAVHPTYVQFVHVWLNIFRVRVLPLLSQEIQSYASSQNIISASELLKFYPSPIEIDADFMLTPPSVRSRPDPLGTPIQISLVRRHSTGSNKDFKQNLPTPEKVPEMNLEELPSKTSDNLTVQIADIIKSAEENSRLVSSEEKQLYCIPERLKHTSDEGQTIADVEEDADSRSSIPGSEIGDYQGMAAWEQGRMDYMGSASSENILKRLHFLMDNASETENVE